MVAFFPDGGRGEGDGAFAGDFEQEVCEGLVGQEVEGDAGGVEVGEAGLEGAGEEVEAVEGDDAVGGDEEDALRAGVLEAVAETGVGVQGGGGLVLAALADLGEQDGRVGEQGGEGDGGWHWHQKGLLQ